VYLSPVQRSQAAAIPRALKAAAGHHTPSEIEAAARAGLVGLDLDYVAVRNTDLGPPRPGEGRLLVAARLGTTRLLDNCAVRLEA
jgi:pantoate--beta-alanine ligase